MRRRRMQVPVESAILAALTLAACGPTPPVNPPVPDPLPVADPADVESVIFFYGDAGDATMATSPLLTRMQQDVEWWAERLPADSSIIILNLGDIVYPEGVREPDHPAFASDTTVLMSQVRVGAGPAALERGVRQFFTAGNHDWGLEEHWEGYLRLLNLDAQLAAARSTLGAHAYLVPEAGTGGPYIVDLGEYFRLLILDTAWWVHLADDAAREEVIDAAREAMEGADGRSILIASHHPFRSAGAHGGEFDFWKTLGIRYVLNRSGAVLQDLTSIPYRRFESGFRGVFAELEPPLIFAGGHDHSLQVLAGTEPTDPVFNLVSGSASKLSGVGTRPGVLFGAKAPGYMRLVIERDGDADLYVEATEPEYLACPPAQAEPPTCMDEGIAAFRTVYWREIR